MKKSKPGKKTGPANLRNAGYGRNESARTGYLQKKGLEKPAKGNAAKRDC